MVLDWIDRILRLAGGLLAYVTLAILFLGIWRGVHRQVGRTTGRTGVWLHSGWFYLITAALFLAACGSLLIYMTWTTLFLACSAPLFAVRARREEAALALEFGEQWQSYCQRVPMWLPKRRKNENNPTNP
jgi:protein-S-isoprenylcysteine O-methyltransferase Ste14